MQHSNAMLNTDTMEVICGTCNAPIGNISEPMKRALKSAGQILRTDIKKAFVMACRACNANREVVLSAKDETVCKICKGPIQVHAAMKQAIKEFGEKDTTVEVETVEVADEVKTRKRKVKKSADE
jgi:hypothetical protein